MERKIWFITGISSGLGKALAQSVIENGDFVIGTFRNQTEVDEFNIQHLDKAIALLLNITNVDQVKNVFNYVANKLGRIDVLVNNAGYGFVGAIEETSIEETKAVFEANFYGALRITQTFLPLLREQKFGHIIQISSHGGFKAFPGFGIYNASKFALEGFSEALALEVAPLGIKVTIVEPGPFRTNFAGGGLKHAENVIDDYSKTAGEFRERLKFVDGKQEGDPIKAAQAIFDISKLEEPPLRLPLGKIAILSINAKLESVSKDLHMFKELAESCVY